ncbi:alpha/beta hydrolase-fold protein [Streptomyces sp. NPDC048253]|uniref:alpha/beta hydrolase-fold protein n=1 Tax=Streptomyces sp. NPDC048253 TaxID=3365524 RepID=UPI003715C2BC
MERRTFIAGSAIAGAMAVVGGVAYGAAAEPEGTRSSTERVRGVTAITKVFGDGQKLIAVAVEYDQAIDSSSLSASTFAVTDRTVTKVYANRTADLAERGRDGRYVIVELSADDEAAALWVTQQGGGAPTGTAAPSAEPSPTGSGGTGGGPGQGGPVVGDDTPGGTIVAAKATLTQKGTVTTARGARYAADDTELVTSDVVNLIVDDFQQLEFADPATGRTLKYNLFVPKNYDPRKKYPLVLFMHDASVVNVATQGPLVQGLGAVCWASDADQAEHESFVLAPAYGSVVVDDTYKPSTLFDATANLVEEVTRKYSIDSKRRYATGQSMGAMMSLGLNIKYPDLFAAAYVVAGQWPSDVAAPLAGKDLWIVVSQDDDKSYAGENAITQVIKEQGTKVATAVWDGRSTSAQFAADVRALKGQKATVNYASFQTGTTVPSGSTTSAHMGTWRIAYSIPGIRDWIMRQSR